MIRIGSSAPSPHGRGCLDGPAAPTRPTGRMHLPRSLMAGVLLTSALGGCGGEGADAPAVERQVLADGTVHIRYATLPTTGIELLVPDLEIGKLDGEPYETFGDIRGVAADDDGTIYVLDFQAAEVRAFDADGTFRETIVRPGEGPGEIRQANGLLRGPDGTLWIQDHRRWMIVGVDRTGNEVGRLPMPVLEYGYIWNGVLDDRGRWWAANSQSDIDPPFPPPLGLQEVPVRLYQIVHDPATGTSDSIFVGERDFRMYVAQVGNGWLNLNIPFESGAEMTVDPAGGFWTASRDAYQIFRLDETADTVMVIEVGLDPLPVTEEDRNAFLSRMGSDRERIEAARSAFDYAPALKPVVDFLAVDGEGRLWVRRVSAAGEPPIHDVFNRNGEWLTTIQLGVDPIPQFPLRVRDNALYTVHRDSLDVPSVIRIPLPELGGG